MVLGGWQGCLRRPNGGSGPSHRVAPPPHSRPALHRSTGRYRDAVAGVGVGQDSQSTRQRIAVTPEYAVHNTGDPKRPPVDDLRLAENLWPIVTQYLPMDVRWFLERRWKELLRWRLRWKDELEYTGDYVSRAAPHWERALASFKGAHVRALEIGSFEGRSTLWFVENVLTHEESTIVCVDVYYEPRFDHNIAVSGASRKVEKRVGRSDETLIKLEGERFDFVYIDGSHLAHDVLMDAMAAWRLLPHGGVMIFDDYRWMPERLPLERPAMAIDLFLETARSQLDVLHKDFQVIVRKRANSA